MLQFNKTFSLLIGALMISIIISSVAYTQTKEKKVDEQASNKEVYNGNRSYVKADYKSANAAYQKAMDYNPLNARAAFNMGNAFYRDTAWSSARTSYSNVINNTKAPKATRANTFYNIGNSHLEEQKYKEAIEDYKNALRLNPNNYASKYNLAYAQQKLKEQQDKDEKYKDKDKEKDKDKNKKDDSDNKDDKDKKDDQKDKDNKDQEDKKDPKDEPKKEENKPQGMKEKEIEAKLNALNQEEKKIQERKNGEKGAVRSQQKDW